MGLRSKVGVSANHIITRRGIHMELKVAALESLPKGTVVRYPRNLGQNDAPTEWGLVAVSANDEGERFRGILFLENERQFVPLHPGLPVLSTGRCLIAVVEPSSVRLMQDQPGHRANALIVNGPFVGFYVPALGEVPEVPNEVFVTLEGTVESVQTAIVEPIDKFDRRCYGIIGEWRIRLGDASGTVARLDNDG